MEWTINYWRAFELRLFCLEELGRDNGEEFTEWKIGINWVIPTFSSSEWCSISQIDFFVFNQKFGMHMS